jgi:hypothetical protein
MVCGVDYVLTAKGGTKVSGPYFYGFSDSLTQYLVKKLPGYAAWSLVKDDP